MLDFDWEHIDLAPVSTLQGVPIISRAIAESCSSTASIPPIGVLSKARNVVRVIEGGRPLVDSPARTHPASTTHAPPIHPYAPLPKDTDPEPKPREHCAYLCLLRILLYLTKSCPDIIMAAVSFAGGMKSSNPTDNSLSVLYCVVEYLRATDLTGHILHPFTNSAKQTAVHTCEGSRYLY